MPVCVRCHQDTGVLGALRFNKQISRCGKCQDEINAALARFRTAFLDFCRDGLLSPDEWARLTRGSASEGIDLSEALTFIRTDALHLLERTLSFAAADGMVSEQEAQDILQLQQTLQISPQVAKPILDRLGYLRHITEVRRGKLPTIKPSVRIESDEICHMEVAAGYVKVNAKSTTVVPGRFVATNKKLHFLSPGGGAEIDYKKIMRTDRQPTGVYLEMSVKKGNGFYQTQDPTLVEATIDTLVRMAKRQLLAPQEETMTRHIPHDIKQTVWQRDQGKCVQCGDSSYLEFDHIIPFSKGGANTINNVQLLCRRCNLAKGDRI